MCAYKPPSQRFSQSTSTSIESYPKSFEKKDLLTIISDLNELIDNRTDGNRFTTKASRTLDKLSALIVSIGNIQYTKQLGWNTVCMPLIHVNSI